MARPLVYAFDFCLLWVMRRRSSKSSTSTRKGTEHDFTRTALHVVEQAIGEQMDGSPLPNPNEGKNPHAVALGKLGGAKGGKARAKSLSPSRRKAIASAAAKARWRS
jgi:hypothetical protein